MTTFAEGVDIHELLMKRRSGRSYDPARPLTDQDVNALLEAARWAPSGGNVQPWRYALARRGEPRIRLPVCRATARCNRIARPCTTWAWRISPWSSRRSTAA